MSDSHFGVYRMEVSKGGNIAFAVLFILLLLGHLFQSVKYKQRWLGVCFFIGTALEIMGYCARALAKEDEENKLGYIVQSLGLTLAPIFIMAGYYYLLAQTATIYGPIVCLFRPIWYSYIFIFCDVFALMMQSAGGGLASSAQIGSDTLNTGRKVMVGGLGFQVATMTVFLFFWVLLFYKVYYHTDRAVPLLARSTKRNLLDMQYKDHIFNPEYAHVRETPKFLYFPFVVFVGTLATYVRCVFRVVELAQGWNGYLMVQEHYSFLLDGLMMVLACLLIAVYYPGWVYGKGNKIKVPKSLRAQKQQQQMEQAAYDDQKSPHDRQNTVYDDDAHSLKLCV